MLNCISPSLLKKIIVFILPGSTHEFLFRISVKLITSLNEVLKIFATHVLADEKNSFTVETQFTVH